jgi:hypothetical protein
MYDIFFICYNESNRIENWNRVVELHPNAKMVYGVTDIAKAHLRCNELCTTERFWTIDGDNWLLDSLDVDEYEEDLIFFDAIDPIDNYVSTIGGVKLWKKNSFINTTMDKGDFCKFATKTYKVIHKSLSIHRYDNTPEEAWRHTFRHIVKSLTGIISKEVLEDNLNRAKEHEHLNSHSYRGYLDALEYVKECGGDFTKINLINDYDWLSLKCAKKV